MRSRLDAQAAREKSLLRPGGGPILPPAESIPRELRAWAQGPGTRDAAPRSAGAP